MNKLKKGDKVWIQTYNYSGHLEPAKEVEIFNIGVKYLYVKEDWREYKFHKETLKSTDGYRGAILYLSKQEYEDKQLFEVLMKKVKAKFGTYGNTEGVTLDQLKQIDNILT